MDLFGRRLACLTIVTFLIFQLATSLAQTDLQFSPDSYVVNLIPGVSNGPGSYVTTIGFNRPLQNTETVIFLPSSLLIAIDQETLNITAATTIVNGFDTTIAVLGSGSSVPTASLKITVIDPAEACDSQAAGSCSQTCILSSTSQDGYECSCLDGYVLLRDGRTCAVNDPAPTILLSHGSRISQVDTFRRQSSTLYQQPNNSNVMLFDFDYAAQFIYYTTQSNSIIVRTTFDGVTSIPVVTSTDNSIGGLAVDWVSGNVLYSDSELGTIQQYHVTSGHVTSLITGLKNPKAIAVVPNADNSFIFWFEETPDSTTEFSIKRASLRGNNILTFDISLTNPSAMAVDVTNNKLYWIDSVGVVSRSSFNGTDIETVFNGGQSLDSLAVFEDFAYVASITGTTITGIDKREIDLDNNIELQLPFSGIEQIRIFHPLAQTPVTNDVNECLINNGGCNQGCTNTLGSYYCSCIHGYGLLDDQQTCVNTAQCSVQALGCGQGCGLESNVPVCQCNPGYQLGSDNTTCQDVNECLEESECSHGCLNTDGGFKCSCPNGLFIGPDRRNCIGCSIDNGGCSQTCVILTDSFQCQCETGYVLGSDQEFCFPERASALFTSVQFGGNSASSVIETTASGFYLESIVKSSASPSIQSTGEIIGMDIDVSRGYLYFGDRTNRGLFRVALEDVTDTGDGRELVVDNVMIWGVVYDWVNEYVYFTDDESGKLSRVSVNGGEPFSVEDVLTGLDTPRGVTVEPFTKYLYWTEGGDTPRVARASLDNLSSDQTIYNQLNEPTGITINYLTTKLIWASNQTIYSSNLDGTNVQELVSTNTDQSPFQILVTGDRLYWTSSAIAGLNVMTLEDTESLVFLPFQGTSPISSRGITAIDENKRPESGYHGCLVNALGCSHYCSIDSNGDAVCTCPEEYVLLEDNKTCAYIFSCPAAQTCDGSFGNTSGIPLFFRPSVDGQKLNTPTTPMMVQGQELVDCDLVSVKYVDYSCQFETIEDEIFSISGSGLFAADVNSDVWLDLNGRVVTIALTCSDPDISEEFCIKFEVSSIATALSCGQSNGGCSDFCTTEFSLIPVCTCQNGMRLGQNGMQCIDPCSPNPCQNGGVCSINAQGSAQCSCPQSHAGPFCISPSQPTCPNDFFCNGGNSESVTVQRLVGGDLLSHPLSLTVSEQLCIGLDGYCSGNQNEDCDNCQCGPQDSYSFQTGRCSNEGCAYKLGGSSQVAPPLYFNPNDLLVSVATGNQLPIVHSGDDSPISSECVVDKTEVDTGSGWSLVSLDTVELVTSNGNTYLSAQRILMDELDGQLIRVTLTCTSGGNSVSGCLTFTFYGTGSDISVSETCNTCEGHLAGYEGLGVSVITRIAPGGSDGELSNLDIIFNGTVVGGCNENEATYMYYNDDCNVIPVPDNLIYATQSRIFGRNIDSSSWDTIVGHVITINLRCNNQDFCLKAQLQDFQPANQPDPCTPNPCSNSGSCTPIGEDDFYCSCLGGFTGQTCSEIDYCTDHICLNDGTCVNGPIYATCLCLGDAIPPFCIKPDSQDFGPCDLSPCNNGGTCVIDNQRGYFCNCLQGFDGIHCDLNDPCYPNPCTVNQTCVVSGTGFVCNNNNGGGGSEGEDDACDSNPCANGGTCAEGGPVGYTCTCSTGFTGTNCLVDVNECDSNPCANGGTCEQGDPGQFTCTCSTGFTGTNCSVDINECDSNPCANGGTCEQGDPGQFTCTCSTGFTGTNCSVDINECDSNPCANGGTCEQGDPGQFTCTCSTGFTGTNCSVDINECDSNPCANGGTCEQGDPGQFTCTCSTGFTGTNCSVDINECDSNPCANGGTCEQGDPGQFTCTCSTGFTGTNCSVDINECDSNPCANGGTCAEGGPGQFTCDCADGFTGLTCRDNINECLQQPSICQNGGTCADRVPGFFCDCARGYTGDTCENECPEGTFGDGCSQSCNCANNAPCDHVTGVCICIGYTGTRCETPLCNPSCQNGGECIAPNQCSCPDSFTGPDCTARECTPTYCSGDRGSCTEFQGLFIFCTCNTGFSGDRCEVTGSSQLGAKEKGGVSAGVIVGVVIALVVIVAAVFFIWKVVIPYRRKRNGQFSTWYLDSSMVRSNPSASVEDLLESEYVAREFKDRGISAPLDNPIYGYVPPNVDPASKSMSIEDSDSSNSDEWEGLNHTPTFSETHAVPNTVIVNRHTSTGSHDNESNNFHGNEWKTTDTRVGQDGDMV